MGVAVEVDGVYASAFCAPPGLVLLDVVVEGADSHRKIERSKSEMEERIG